MIRSVLVMQPKAGCEGDIVDLFQRDSVFERAMTVDGCHDVTMLLRDEEILVIGSWRDASAYEAWMEHPERSSSSEELNELLAVPLSPETAGGLYDVVLGTDTGNSSS